MNHLLLLGLNHTTAPLEVREKLAFDAEQQRRAVAELRGQFPKCEAVLLSTCNRVELYVAREPHTSPTMAELTGFLARFQGVSAGAFETHLYYKSGREAVEHLFSVTSSLDSMVLGETQILGQVRDAYDLSRQLQSAGPLLHPLFQRAIAVGKQVMHETALGEGRLSIASVAVDYARRIFDHFADKTVLCIGAGKMASLVLQNFVALSPGRLLVCNRDPSKAQALAAKFGGQAVAFERLADHLVAADIVVSSTGSQQPIITRGQFESLRRVRRYRPIFLIDIAVPRDVESSVGEWDDVYLYNLDDLQQVVQGTQSHRQGAISAARAIVLRQVDEFSTWHRQREMGPIIDLLKRRSHDLWRDEVERTLNKLGGDAAANRASLEEMARRIVNKLLHQPIQTLRSTESPHPASATYLHALEKLFGLNSVEKPAEAQPRVDSDAADDSDHAPRPLDS
jgi:glutamyl-tRNA reductase